MSSEDLVARRAIRERLARLERARDELPSFMRRRGYSDEDVAREVRKLEEIAEVEEESLQQ